MRSIKSWFDFQKYAINASFALLKKEALGSMLTIFAIAIILMLSSLAWILRDAMQVAANDWQTSSRITLYLQLHSEIKDQEDLLIKIKSIDGVANAQLITADDAINSIKSQKALQHTLDYLPENPLPSIIEIVPSAELDTQDKIQSLYTIVKNNPLVADSYIDMQWIKHVFGLLNFIENLLNTLVIVLIIVLLLVVGNTLRLIINDRREEITVLKFIGANDKYIMRPYLYSGVWYSMLAAIIAITCLNLLFIVIQDELNSLLGFYNIHCNLNGLNLSKTIVLLIISSALGWIGARVPVQKYLLN